MKIHIPEDCFPDFETSAIHPVGQWGQAPDQNDETRHQTQPEQSTSLPADIAFLENYGFTGEFLNGIWKTAQDRNVEAREILVATGELSRQTYFRCLAHSLYLTFVTADDIGPIELLDQDGIIHALRHDPKIIYRTSSGERVLAISPKEAEIETLKARLQASPDLARRVVISDPTSLRQAYLNQVDTALINHASKSLHKHMPLYSALRVAKLPFIILTLVLLFAVFLIGLLPLSSLTMLVSGAVAGVFFLAVGLRLLAALILKANKARIPAVVTDTTKDLPVYSVLVALYDEAEIVPDLVKALDALQWPKEKLDIKLVLEADDKKTIAAARRSIEGQSSFEVVVVPDGKPKTKPRALNFALPLARGDYLVIYDAEDRPSPDQLRAAFQRFLALDHQIACVQAPLLIDNESRSWLSTMFGLEYAGLFDGFIPALARWRLPVLLGGTSNHFKTSVLRSVGAWDPYNVTEDADLGIRLSRFGYRVETIDEPTFEEAPETFDSWKKQRTRWFKGWMQTVLVHMRNPVRTLAELKLRGFLTYHLISTSLLASALGYPFFLTLVLYHFCAGLAVGTISLFTLVMVVNFAFAFFVYGLLAARASSYRGKSIRFMSVLLLPFYWLLLSYAAWRALFQLGIAPHKWEKTTHGQVKRIAAPWL